MAAIAAAIGIYLIATTVLIAKDGLFYIDQARKLVGDLPGEPEIHLLGFPMMIASFRWILTACGMGGGLNTWIVSAQAVSLLARLLCLIPVYLIGKRFVGRRRSILGIFILIVLPLPAEWGADTLRDFPSLLLLLSSLALLIAGAESGRMRFFALAGLACGIGIAIREELVQLVLYAMLWFAWRFLTARSWADRGKQAASCLVFLIMVSLPAGLHICASGWRLPVKTTSLLLIMEGAEPSVATGMVPSAAVSEDMSVSDASYRIVQMLGGNFHEYFYPFWV
ncbi:MAG: glycosyltransferase family 39 protein, partial [Planctomycetes bacterium]|nr:glycosyltransferase family 39 protein [Planctomycetota bacterium]